jgi:hypothetical protein
VIELEVCYLLKGHYQSRKAVMYNKMEDALKIYDLTILKFKKNKQQALITIRVQKENKWFIEKIERL